MQAITTELQIKCINNHCLIIPVKVYTRIDSNGEPEANSFIGIKYVAQHFEPELTPPDYFLWCDITNTINPSELYNSPDEAFSHFLTSRDEK